MNEELSADIHNLRQITPNSLPRTWGCNVYTTIKSQLDVLQLESFQRVRDIIYREAEAYAKSLELDIENHPLKLTDCWFNIYGNGDSQERHIHRNNIISGNYYVQAPEGCGELVFHSPVADVMLDPPKTAMNPYNSQSAAIEP